LLLIEFLHLFCNLPPVYRRIHFIIQNNRENVNNHHSCYRSRYNLIPSLVETVKGYAKHEQETLQQVITARNSALAADGVKAQTSAENQLNSALANVFALSEAYPDLKANTNFLQLQKELSAIEGDVEKARRYYNATVRENNIMVESFPSNFIANSFSFYAREYFEIEDAGERSMPEVKF
jgi:LemA protein